jgi:hypothetical protein
MVLVKSATVVEWHRAGFRLYWRWRSRAGRPRAAREIRDLIRQMSKANPLWGAPRIHGEILKLGIDVSQATVAKYMVRRVGRPSPTWRSFLRNQAAGIAAIDMFVVVSASFQLLYVMIILADRRRIVRFDVTEHPTASWLSQQVTGAFPWDTAPRYLLRDRDPSYGTNFRRRVEAMGIVEVITARAHLGRMRTSSGSSGRYAASVWTTSSSSTSAICAASSYLISIITIALGRISHWTRTALSSGRYRCPRSEKLSPSPQVGGMHHRYQRLAA